ncbi:MAG: preprotein translocase subunit YajC [Treponema sp.]|jgi:preprotein translocase subunit YajC|nr:preprotein translocase subunit YajC [Treponema sp.]
MNTFVLSLLAGSQEGSTAPQGGAAFLQFLPFIAIIAIFYFLIIRPQNKKQKETQRMLEALKKGDKVITVGGIHGIIQNVRDHSVVLKVDDNVRLEFNRSAISSVESAAKEDKGGKEDKRDEKSDDSDAAAETSEARDK